MTTPSLSDLRFLYYGGGSAAEYAFLQAANAAGITAQDVLSVASGIIEGTLDHNGTTAGFYGAIPTPQAIGIANPTAPGVVYVQAEAASTRNAVVSLITALENLGLIATV